MRQGLFLLLFLLLSGMLSAQFTNPDCIGFEDVPIFSIDDQEVCQGEQVCLDVEVSSYVNVESFQFILSWDPTVLEFVNGTFVQTSTLGNVISSNSSSNSDDGVIFIIYEAFGNQETVVDGSAIFEVCFDVVGEPGDNANFNAIGGFNASTIEILYGNGCIFNYPMFGLGDVEIKCAVLSAQVSQCHSNSGNGSITIQPCGGVPPYMYTITGPSNRNGSILDDESVTEGNLPPGAYIVTINDASGTPYIENVQIENTNDLSVGLVDASPPLCANFTNGSIEVFGDGGQTMLGFGYEYQWSNGQYTPDIGQLTSGLYTVTVTDLNGCTATDEFDLGVSPIVIDAMTIPDTCNGGVGSILFNISGGIPILGGGYDVNIFPIIVSSPTFGDTLTGVSAGTYDIEVKDSQSCPMEVTVVVGEFQEQLTSTTIIEGVSCAGECDASIDLTINQTGTYSFDPVINSNNVVATDVQVVGNTISIENLCGGIWSLSAMDVNTSCAFDTLIIIGEPDPLTIVIGNVNNSTNCNNPNGEIFVDVDGGTGNYEYTWVPDVNNTNTYLGAEEGLYTITVEDMNGCTASTFTEIIQQGAADVEITVIDGIGCNGSTQGRITAEPIGDSALNYTYVWNNLTLGAQEGNVRTIDVDAGEYEVIITHLTSECTSRDTVNLFSTNDLTFEVTGTDLRCNGVPEGIVEIFDVVGGGGNYTVDWGVGYEDEDGLILTGASAGLINFTVMDMQGCSLDGSFTLDQPAEIRPDRNDLLITGITCPGGSDGVMSVFVPDNGNMTNGYTFDWPDPIADEFNVNSSTASGFGPGMFEVTITDDSGCSVPFGFQFLDIDSIAINENLSVTIPPECVGQCDGFVELVIEGGTPSTTNFEYFIEWEDGNNDFERTGLCPDVYTVTVTDGNSCTQELTIDFGLTGDTLTLEIDTLLTSTLSCNSELGGQIVVIAEGGIQDYSYQWTDGISSTSIATNLEAGLYEVTVTDMNLCTASTSFVMEGAPPLEIDLFDALTVECAGSTLCLEVGIPSGGSGPPYLYQLNNQPPVLPIDSCITVFAGVYNLTIIDSENCILDTLVEVLEPSIPSIDLGGDLEVDLGDTDVIIEADYDGDEVIDTIIWTTIDTINCLDAGCQEIGLSVTQDQQISVIVTDNNGCTAVDQITVTVNEVRNVFLPTVFMPDVDTERTFMVHLGQGAEVINYLAVFDRWGNLMYRVDDVLAEDTGMYGWTGRFNNQDSVEGVYVYIVEVLFSDGQVRRYTRDITLLR